MLCRIDLADPATVATLEACARAVTELAGHGLMAMVEPFMSHRVDGQVRNDLSAEAVVTSVGDRVRARRDQRVHLAQAAGGATGMDAVMAATTLPTLLLGGDPDGDPEETYGQLGEGAGAARRARPGGRPDPALPAGRRRRRRRRRRGRAGARAGGGVSGA